MNLAQHHVVWWGELKWMTSWMEKNASWTNRVAGATDEAQNAYKIDPSTLRRKDNGVALLPKHVHKALRGHLGLANTSVDQNFKFFATEDIRFFG